MFRKDMASFLVQNVGVITVAMVIEMHKLRLIQRQHPLIALPKDTAFQCPAIGFEVFPGVEEVGVVGHVKHGAEGHAPRVAGVALALIHEHGHPAVDAFGDLGVPLGAEDRASACIGVE